MIMLYQYIENTNKTHKIYLNYQKIDMPKLTIKSIRY